ncbi:HAD-IIA family hydrolase [Kineococcus gynurae]|uniref:HAD-IIA family hydrolase n=1 Tax=Kineococcus gynurae TaxID=452979 RepID=A0ABV5LXW5_9ACTN
MSTTSTEPAVDPTPATLRSSRGTLLEDHDALFLDLDGVVYVGPRAVPHAVDALAHARAAGLRLAYITNNASRPPSAVAEHLRELGIPAEVDEVVSSAQAAAAHLAGTLPPGAPVLVVGGAGLRLALEAVGLRPVSSLAEEPQAVVQGFSPDLGWRELTEGTHAVRSGLPYVASNLDRTVPHPGGPAPGNGLLVDLVSRAAGRGPDVVCGKPERPLFDEAIRRAGVRAPLMVGDRLDTDLQGAVTAGLPGLLVLTGVTGVAELLAAGPHERPRFVAADLRGTGDRHPGAEVHLDGTSTTVVVRGAEVIARAGTVEVVRDATGEDGLDLLRAAAEVAWQSADAGRPVDIPALATRVGGRR